MSFAHPSCSHTRDAISISQDTLGEMYVGLASVTPNLRKEQIDAEGCVLVLKVSRDGAYLLPQDLGGVPESTNDTKPARVRDRSRELGASGDVHSYEDVRTRGNVGNCSCAPARRMGCLMPKSSVTGVVIVVMVDGGKGNERLGDGHSDGFMGDNQARFRHASSPDAGIGCVVPGQAARHEITLLSCH